MTTPDPPYFAVIFSSVRTNVDADSYEAMANRMVELAAAMPGFLGIESARGENGFGITVSYWASEQAIRDWQRQADHLVGQRLGREKWYERFELRVSRVDRAYGFCKPTQSGVAADLQGPSTSER